MFGLCQAAHGSMPDVRRKHRCCAQSVDVDPQSGRVNGHSSRHTGGRSTR